MTRRSTPIVTFAAGALLTGVLMSALTQDQDKPVTMTPELMAKMMELAKPGPEHKLLEKMSGTWEQTYKVWMSPANPKPMEMNGSTSSSMILGGRFLLQKGKGGAGPWEAETHYLMGFDRRNGKFTSVALDTMGTYFVTMSGDYDEKSKTITMSGEDYDGLFKATQKYTFKIKFLSDDETLTELWFTQGPMLGKHRGPFKMMELHSKRKKS